MVMTKRGAPEPPSSSFPNLAVQEAESRAERDRQGNQALNELYDNGERTRLLAQFLG